MTDQSQIEAFVAALNAAHGSMKPGYEYSIDKPGPKYTRIVQQFLPTKGSPMDSGRGVYCFIDNATNDILKADGWKKPAKGARGNLATVDVSQCDPFGSWLYKR